MESEKGADPAAGHVVLCYARADAEAADWLQGALEAGGVRVWRDIADVWPGDDWRQKVRQAMAGDAIAFVACFSRGAVERDRSAQFEELSWALEVFRERRLGRPWLIPVRLDDCEIPNLDIGGGRTLSSLNWVDLFGQRRDQELARLVTGVGRMVSAMGPAGVVKDAAEGGSGQAADLAAVGTQDLRERASRAEGRRRRMTTEGRSTPRPAPDPQSGKPPADRTQMPAAVIAGVPVIAAAVIGATAIFFSSRNPTGAAPAPSVSTAARPSSSRTGPLATAHPHGTAPSSAGTSKAITSTLFLSGQSPFRRATAALSARRTWRIENQNYSHGIGFPGLCSPAAVTYALNGSYGFFSATAGIADGLSRRDRSRTIVFDVVNGQSGAKLYEATAKYKFSKTINFPLAKGITSIELEARILGGGCLSSQSVVVWGNAKLIRRGTG